jgi:hypothetical protein
VGRRGTRDLQRADDWSPPAQAEEVAGVRLVKKLPRKAVEKREMRIVRVEPEAEAQAKAAVSHNPQAARKQLADLAGEEGTEERLPQLAGISVGRLWSTILHGEMASGAPQAGADAEQLRALPRKLERSDPFPGGGLHDTNHELTLLPRSDLDDEILVLDAWFSCWLAGGYLRDESGSTQPQGMVSLL